MSRHVTTVLTAAAVGVAAFWAGKSDFPVRMPFKQMAGEANAVEVKSAPPPTGAVIYYRNPDGSAEYSAAPKNTKDGRAFVAVRESEDVTFDPGKAGAGVKAADNEAKERKVLYYRNPMGLPDTSKVPKKDSMGMDYLPVYEGEANDGSTVTVAPGKLQRTGVKTATAQKTAVARKLTLPGTVVLDERLISVVSMRTEAFVEDVADVTTGDRIRKGDVLFHYYSKEIAAAGAQYLAELSSSVAQPPDTGAALRLRNLGVPVSAIKSIAANRKVGATIAYTAPQDGVVLERTAVNGMMAVPGAALFRVADLSKVWVLADVPESELGMIRLGGPASVTFRQRPGAALQGTVGAIYPEVQMQTRTAKVRIELPNPDGLLLPNMYALVAIGADAPDAVTAVPNSAIIDTGDRQLVFLDRGDGKYEPRNVRLGARGEEMTEVLERVAVGDRVVVAANFLLDAESNLNSALSSMSDEEAQK